MTQTIKQQLQAVCSARGLEWRVYPDQPIYGPRPFTKYWGCAYAPDDSRLAAFISGAPGRRSAKRALMQAVEEGETPTITSRRAGVVLQRFGSDWLVVRFEDGEVSWMRHETGTGSYPGNTVEVVTLDGEPEPLRLWGPTLKPERATASLISRRSWFDSVPVVLAREDTGPRPWVLEAWPQLGVESIGAITIRPARLELPAGPPPTRAGAGGSAWGYPMRTPLVYQDWLWDPRWQSRAPVIFGTVSPDATRVDYIPEHGALQPAKVLDSPDDWPLKAFVITPDDPPRGSLIAKQQDRPIAKSHIDGTERASIYSWSSVPPITAADVLATERLVAELPEVQELWTDHLANYKEPRPYGFVIAYLNPWLGAKGSTLGEDSLRRIWSAVEDLAASPDRAVRDVAASVVTHLVSGTARGHPRDTRALNAGRPWFGPSTQALVDAYLQSVSP
jgi:hypothetical protein